MTTVIPTVGRIVHYQTDERGGKRYILPAVITCVHSSHPDGEGYVFEEGPAGPHSSALVDDTNPVPIPNSDAGYVHLHVMTPGGQTSYTEWAVPFDDSDAPFPRTWHWPPRS
jgi:hypothetical protein